MHFDRRRTDRARSRPVLQQRLVRYLDFNDSYRTPGGTRHPSDNLGPVLPLAITPAVPDFLTALAVAYQVQCRLSDLAPQRAKSSII
jgi:2-methylcitrate dehydratase